MRFVSDEFEECALVEEWYRWITFNAAAQETLSAARLSTLPSLLSAILLARAFFDSAVRRWLHTLPFHHLAAPPESQLRYEAVWDWSYGEPEIWLIPRYGVIEEKQKVEELCNKNRARKREGKVH